MYEVITFSCECEKPTEDKLVSVRVYNPYDKTFK